MATKGDKAKLYDVAARMYVDGRTLTEIADTLGVSRQTLTEWKADTKRPGDEKDQWDKAREVKRSYAQRLRELFDRELKALEDSLPGTIAAGNLDGVTKLGTLVQRWEAAETTPQFDRPKVFLENLQWIINWLRENNPEGLKVLAEVFDAMTMAFKLECLNVNA